MFKIGEFSKLAQVPVATLRFYDQIGLLAPIETDRNTGYRYYSASQLPRLHRILVLKGLGFSLERIGEVLNEDPTVEQMRGMLRLRHEQLSRELADTRSQLQQVEIRLHQIEGEARLSRYDVLLKDVPAQLVASVRAILPTHGAVTELFGEVYEALGEHAARALGPHRARAVRPWCCGTTPSTRSTTIHHGSYATIGDAHEAVITWIDAHGHRIVGPDREINIYNAQPIRQDGPTYVTEIQYPISGACMTTSQPTIEQRAEQPYMGVRTVTPWQNLPTVIPQFIGEVFGFLEQHGVAPRGAPFVRYHVIDMERELDIEVGVPVASSGAANGRIKPASLTAGRYASLIHTAPTTSSFRPTPRCSTSGQPARACRWITATRHRATPSLLATSPTSASPTRRPSGPKSPSVSLRRRVSNLLGACAEEMMNPIEILSRW